MILGFAFVFLFIFVLLPAVIFWFDKFTDLCNGLKRYHIGQWNSSSSWEAAITKQSIIWSKRPPVVSVDDQSSYKLIRIMSGKYRNQTVQSWQDGMLALGLMEYGKSRKISYDVNGFISKYISADGEWKCKVDRVDYALLSYALLKISNDPGRIAPAMDRMVHVIEENCCEDGMISYSLGKNSFARYVDTLGMVCPFLALYGKVYGKQQYIDLSIKQIAKFRAKGVLSKYALPCHVYNAKLSIPLGIYGWGRGTAWYFLALIDTWLELEPTQARSDLLTWIIEAADSYSQFQASDGGFSTILQGGGDYDSSVTAAMAYFYKVCASGIDKHKYEVVAENCLKKIQSVTMQSGAIDCCQGDTHGIGMFSRVFDVMPFAQGLVLRALSIDAEDHDNE